MDMSNTSMRSACKYFNDKLIFHITWRKINYTIRFERIEHSIVSKKKKKHHSGQFLINIIHEHPYRIALLMDMRNKLQFLI